MSSRQETRERTAADGTTELTEEVRLLREEIQVLRDAVDELREELGWRNRNTASELPNPLRVTSMAADPTADNFRLNQVPADKVAELREAAMAGGPEEKLGGSDDSSHAETNDSSSNQSQGRLF